MGSSIILPEIYTITGENPEKKDIFLQKLKNCLGNGARLIQLRAHQLKEHEYEELAKESIKICAHHDVILLLNCDVKIAGKLDADGMHLTSSQLLSLSSRPLSRNKIIGASCHNEKEVTHAKKISVDFITLSPIATTNSHPEAKILGWEQFSLLASQIDVPSYALGGVGRQDLMLSKESGGYGIAGISAFWNIEK